MASSRGPLVLLILAAELGQVVPVKYINSFAGPYTAYAISIVMCDLNELALKRAVFYMRASHFNPAKPRERQIINGNLSNDVQLSDDDWMLVNLAIRSNNQWKENAFVFPFSNGACSAARTHLPDFYRVLYKMDPNATGPCVAPPGVQVIDNEPVAWDFPYFSVMPYGHYLFKVKVGEKKEKLPYFCAKVECKAIPRL